MTEESKPKPKPKPSLKERTAHWMKTASEDEKNERLTRLRLKFKLKGYTETGREGRAAISDCKFLLAVSKSKIAKRAFVFAMAGNQRERERIRKKARTTHLAYGFIRGVPYAKMEHSCYTLPHWGDIAAVIEQFTFEPPQTWKQKYAAWLDTAKSTMVYLGPKVERKAQVS